MRARTASALVLLSAFVLAGCATTPAADERMPTADALPDGACAYVESAGNVRDATPPPSEAEVSGEISAVLQTSAGDIPMTLDADATPCTVGSFVSLAEQGFYSDAPCHRLTTEGIFVLQCGDPSGTGRGGPGYRYADELDGSETYPAGTVAMANAGPDTNGSQFFLVYDDTPLPADYTVFGVLDEAGLAVVREVAAAGTEDGAADGAPAVPVTITGVTLG